jgi:hypothetical protein
LKIFKKLFLKSFLNGARPLAFGKLQIRFVGLRLHFPAENHRICTVPRTNAKAEAFASVLQNHEALLRDFGHSQSFPNVGKDCAMSPAPEGREYPHKIKR